MAFSDFDTYKTQDIQLHSAAPLTTNPLSNGGSYCRRFATTYGKLYFTTSAYAGAFFNIPNTKVISARACFRAEGPPFQNGIFLSVKDSATFSGDNHPTGYRFGIQASSPTPNKFTLYGNNNLVLQSTDNWSAGTWYSLRMDVFPISATADRIICYIESSPGSGAWSNTIGGTVFDITLASNNPSYISWSNNGRCGICTDSNSNLSTYVDNINFQVFNAT
jgi:hypothetical protein